MPGYYWVPGRMACLAGQAPALHSTTTKCLAEPAAYLLSHGQVGVLPKGHNLHAGSGVAPPQHCRHLIQVFDDAPALRLM